MTVSDCAMTGADDEPLLRFAASERRVLLTNDVRHFAPLARHLAASGEHHYGLLFTSDASLPRGKQTIGLYVTALDAFMERNRADDALVDQVRWLA